MVKKILSIVAWVVTGAALIVLFVFAYRGYNQTPLKGVVFNLERHGNKGFIEKDSAIVAIEELCGIQDQATIRSVDMMKLHKMLSSSPWIENASAYIGLNDTLFVRAKEFDPIVRVFNKDGRSVYVTDNGAIVPSSRVHAPRMIIASGNYEFPASNECKHTSDSAYASAGIAETIAITKAILSDKFLRGSIGQIYRNEKKQYELMVNGLSARVVIGDTTAINDKMQRLCTLLEKHSGTEELKGFKTLDLRYKNQIVCTKK